MQAPAHVAHTNNPDGTVLQRKTVALCQHQQGGEDIFHDRNGVAARRG